MVYLDPIDFLAGMVRQKNAGSTAFQSLMILCVVSLVWWLFGFSLAYSRGGPVYGNFEYGMLIVNGIDIFTMGHELSPTIPLIMFFLHQMLFAAITCALATGGMAERVKFRTLMVFFFFWVPLVYCPIAHWHWHSEGWLRQLGVYDHAGGNVVHVTSGTLALVFSMFMKKRRGSFSVLDWLRITIKEKILKIREKPVQQPQEMMSQPMEEMMIMGRGSSLEIETPWRMKPITKHSLPFVILGTCFLWFGWYGFNGGAFGTASVGAVIATVNTHMAAVAGAMTYQSLDFLFTGKPRIMAGCIGSVVGMVVLLSLF